MESKSGGDFLDFVSWHRADVIASIKSGANTFYASEGYVSEGGNQSEVGVVTK